MHEDSTDRLILEELNRKDFDLLDEKNQENQRFTKDECNFSVKGNDMK